MPDLELIGQGATAKIYRDGGTAIKLYKNVPPEYAKGEAKRQKLAYDAGLPVPAVYELRAVGDHGLALDMQFVDGPPILHHKMARDERNAAIRTLARMQCDVHKIPATGFPLLTDRLASRIRSASLDEPVKSALLTLLAELADGSENLCHGDFHPLNILYDGAKYWIIDWADATAGSSLADACRTYLLFKQHISRSAGIYLKAFCTVSGAKPDDILAWLPVIAAARTKETMDGKSRDWLLSLVQEWYASITTR